MSIAETIERPWPHPARAWTAVAILNLAYLVSFVDRTILSLLVEPIKADLGLSDTQIALLQGAAFGLFYTVMGLPFGWAVDRWPRTRIIGWGCTLWCLMTAACGLASSFWQLFLARLGVGVGEAALSPGAASMIADLFPPRRRALAMAVYASGGSVGVGVSMLVGGLVVAWVSSAGPIVLPVIGRLAVWQAVLVIVGLAGLLVAAAILALPEPERRVARAEDTDRGELLAFLRARRRRIGFHFGGFALFALASYAVLSWVPAFFTRAHGWTPAEVGLRYGTVFLFSGGSGALAGGWLAGRLERAGVREYNLAVATLGVAAFVPFGVAAPLVDSAWVALALFGVVAFNFALPTGGSIAAIQAITPGRLRGQVAALYYLAMGVVGLLFGPLAVALLVDRVFADEAMLGPALSIVSGVAGTLAAMCVWAAARSKVAVVDA